MPDDTSQHTDCDHSVVKAGFWWWLGQSLLTTLACFFIFFGISLLVGSYGLGDPYSFIMTFFGASLMTLISVVMALGFVLRMWRVLRHHRTTEENDNDNTP